jgi:multimeric flavodoxin WrbA
MAEVISLIQDADVRVLATPLYFDNISSMLKTFIDRLMVTASPYWAKDGDGECRHLTTDLPPQLIMMANCGYPERSHFQVLSHWAKRHARNLDAEIIGEIYASEGALLGIKENDAGLLVKNYLETLETAGAEIATNGKLTEKTAKSLEQKFIPDEIYIHEVQKYVDGIMKRQNL